MKSRILFSAALALVGAAAFAPSAGAATLGVSTFTGGQGDFVFTNNGSSATFDTISGGAAATFSFASSDVAGTPSDLQGDLPVHIILNATTSTAAGSGYLLGQQFDVQPVDSGAFQVLLDTPINGQDDLLTAQFQNASIAGFDGDPGADFSVQDGLDGGVQTYSSDFLTFTGSTAGNFFQFAPSDANPGLDLAGNFLTSFSANAPISFGFASQTVAFDAASVPLPSTAAASLGLLGIVAGFGCFKKSRAASTVKPVGK